MPSLPSLRLSFALAWSPFAIYLGATPVSCNRTFVAQS
jgi:hypothetical protein